MLFWVTVSSEICLIAKCGNARYEFSKVPSESRPYPHLRRKWNRLVISELSALSRWQAGRQAFNATKFCVCGGTKCTVTVIVIGKVSVVILYSWSV